MSSIASGSRSYQLITPESLNKKYVHVVESLDILYSTKSIITTALTTTQGDSPSNKFIFPVEYYHSRFGGV